MNLDGFEKVASEEYQKVNRFLLKLCGDSELAADLTQETFLRAAKSWKSFQGKCSAATWLCSISRHVWTDWCKKPPPVPVEANDTIDTVANPEREVEEKEQRFQVYAWLHMLPETEKEVFMLRTFSDLSHQDIGQLFGKSPEWSRTVYYRAKQAIVKMAEKPVPDLVIDQDEAAIVREIFHLLVNKGYGTVRAAKYLNDKGIKTKRNKGPWRGTAIRALIDNPIYIGHMHMGETLSPKFENLQIIDDDLFARCQEVVKGRATFLKKDMTVPERTDTGSLLSGLLYCKECGAKLYYSHGTSKRKMADGTTRVYGRESYRCYTKLNHPNGCAGPSSYSAELINDAVLKEIRRFLMVIRTIPQEDLLDKAREKHDGVNEVAYRQAEQDYFEAHKQITALEEQAIKALTGENSLDISIVNSMMPKYKEKMEQAQRHMEDAKAKMEQEKEQSKEARREIGELVSWAEAFDDAEPETRRMIIARLVERIDIGADYSISIRFRISMKQYTGDVA